MIANEQKGLEEGDPGHADFIRTGKTKSTKTIGLVFPKTVGVDDIGDANRYGSDILADYDLSGLKNFAGVDKDNVVGNAAG